MWVGFRALCLVSFFLSTSGFGIDLATLVYRRTHQENWEPPRFHYSYFQNSPLHGSILASMESLAGFGTRLSNYALLPEEVFVKTTRGKHYLEAVCFPFQNTICLDETAWSAGNPVIPKGLLGHELGHLIFMESLTAMMKTELGSLLKNAPYKELSQLLQMDTEVVDTFVETWENLHTEFRNGFIRGLPTMHLPPEIYGQYRLMKRIQTITKQQLKDHESLVKALTGEKLLAEILMESMGGFQEVFADFVGAVYTGNPRYLVEILPDEVSQLVRDFTRTKLMGDPSVPAHVQNKIATQASKGIPHLLLFELRQHMYEQFYRRNGMEIGWNEQYDLEVVQKVLNSLLRNIVRVYVTPDAPKTKQAAATLALVYKEIIGGVLYEFEVEAKAFCTKYHLIRIVDLDMTAIDRAVADLEAQVVREQAERLKDCGYNIVNLNIPIPSDKKEDVQVQANQASQGHTRTMRHGH